MKAKNLAGLGLLASAFLSPMLSAEAKNGTESNPEIVRFARGATSQTVTVRLTRHDDQAYFSAQVRAGQKMSVKVAPIHLKQGIVPALYVTSPSGHNSGADAPKARRFDTLQTESGVYRIRVAPNLMASNGHSGTFRLKIWIR